MNVLDLFSGIGGFSLGLERAGMRTVAFCEIDPFARGVLAKHWPDIPCYTDVRALTGSHLAADGIVADVICGGFPCQDISLAGSGAGIEGERSGLWSEYARIIGEVRPRYVIVENVAALLGRGLDRVLGDLAQIGYDAEWHCIPASAVGAPHRRDRLWIVAYPSCQRWGEARTDSKRHSEWASGRRKILADTAINGRVAWRSGDASKEPERRQPDRSGICEDVAHAGSLRSSGPWQSFKPGYPAQGLIGQAIKLINGGFGDIWITEPDMGRVAHGVPNRVDRLKGLGNAVVPQIPEIIGRAIMNACK